MAIQRKIDRKIKCRKISVEYLNDECGHIMVNQAYI